MGGNLATVRHSSPSTPVTSPLEAVDAAFASVRESLDHLMSAVAALDGGVASEWSRDEAARLLAHCTELTNRSGRVSSRVMAAISRARKAGELHHLDDAGLASTVARTDPREARRDSSLAEALGNAAPSDREAEGCAFPTLAAACDAGRVAPRQAEMVIRTLERLPEISHAELERAEHIATRWAATHTPSQLRRRLLRLPEELGWPADAVDQHENEQVRSTEQAAWEKTALWMVDNNDGTWRGQFTLPDLQAHMLKKALDALMRPRRQSKDAAADQDRVLESATGSARFDRQLQDQRRGQAFCELLDHLPTDELGTKINAVLLVRTDLETLRGETDRAGVTDTGATVSAGEIRRLAATAGLIPAVLGGQGQVLDIGRQRRVFTDSQRAALAVLYSECAEETCDRPFGWTEIHHAHPWARTLAPDGTVLHPGGGPTDLSNAIPLCGQHHRQLDDPRLRHVIERDPTGRAVVSFTWRRPGDTWSTHHGPPIVGSPQRAEGTP